MREARRVCATQYQQAVLESADFLGAEEAQRVQGLLASLEEALEGGAKRAAGKAEQEATEAAEAEDEGAGSDAGDGAPVRGKRQRREEGDGQPDMEDFGAEQAGAAGMGPELLARPPPGVEKAMARIAERHRTPPGPG